MKNDHESTVASLPAAAQGVITGHNSGEIVIDFDAIFDAYIAANQKSWAHDRSSTVGASEVWDCLKKVFYEKRGGPEFGIVPDEQDNNWGAMERGNLIENHFVVPGLRLALPKMPSLPDGIELLLAGDEQTTLVLGKNSATPDGLIRGLKPGPLTVRGGEQEIFIPDIGADCIVLEIKSIDPRATLLEERAKHHGQTQVQLGLIREMTPHKPRYSIVLYIDASFLNKVTPFVVEFDEKQYATAKQRALSIWQHDDPMMFMPEGRFTGGCVHCRWRTACGTNIVNAIPAKGNKPGSERAVVEIDPLVKDYLAIRKEYELIEKRMEIAKEAVKEGLLDHNVSTLQGDGWKVTWFPVKGRKTIDQKKLAEDIDLEPYMKEGAPHDQLKITEQLPTTSPKPSRTSTTVK